MTPDVVGFQPAKPCPFPLPDYIVWRRAAAGSCGAMLAPVSCWTARVTRNCQPAGRRPARRPNRRLIRAGVGAPPLALRAALPTCFFSAPIGLHTQAWTCVAHSRRECSRVWTPKWRWAAISGRSPGKRREGCETEFPKHIRWSSYQHKRAHAFSKSSMKNVPNAHLFAACVWLRSTAHHCVSSSASDTPSSTLIVGTTTKHGWVQTTVHVVPSCCSLHRR